MFNIKIYYLIKVIERFEYLYPNGIINHDNPYKQFKRSLTNYEICLFGLLDNINKGNIFNNKEFNIILKLKENSNSLKILKNNLIKFRTKNYIDFDKEYIISNISPIHNNGIDLLSKYPDSILFNNNYEYVYLEGTRCYQNKKVLALIDTETKKLVAAYCSRLYPDKEVLGWHTKNNIIIEENICL